MCGIGGILRTDGQAIPEEWLDAIDARIAYRGPDGCGRFRDRVEIDDPQAESGKRVVEVAFVHRRLSIIDHKDGAQPMVSQRGRSDGEGLVAVVFNGCIYNHRELRKELESKGHRFVTDHSDTEVLIHGWREWGPHLTEYLEGMYAFAIWDRHRRSVWLARDRFGEKPLYLAGSPDWTTPPIVVFSSAISAAGQLDSPYESALLSGPSAIVPKYLLRGYVDGFNACNRWHIAVTFPGFGFSVGDLDDEHSIAIHDNGTHSASAIESLIARAVARRLEADVPLGCFLSGGVDSSLVAHFACCVRPDVRTFSVRMPDQRYDESVHAERAAKHLKTNHTTLDVAADPAHDLVHLIEVLGAPFGDSSILPTYWVSKAARQHVKVALSGDGGDEMFLGYERYSAARLLSRHWRWLQHLPASILHRAHPKSSCHKLARLRDMAQDFPVTGLASMEVIFTTDEIAQLTGSPWNEVARCEPGDDPLSALRQFDVENYLPDDLLRKVDTASMACGLEVRCPFLDRDLARAALSMPVEQLMPRGQRKGLLRNIARKYLPKEIVDRPKMGFAIPIGEWFRDDDLPQKASGMRTLLLDHLNSAEPFGPISLNRKAIQRFIDEHLSRKRDHGHKLFTLLTLSIWAQQMRKLGGHVGQSI